MPEPFDYAGAEHAHLVEIEARQRALEAEAEKVRRQLAETWPDKPELRRQCAREVQTFGWLLGEVGKLDALRVRVRRQLAEITGRLRDPESERPVSVVIHHGPPDPGDRPTADDVGGASPPEGHHGKPRRAHPKQS